MNIYQYTIRRTLYAVPILIGVTLVIFLLFNVVAGDPTAVLLGKYATPHQMAELRHELSLIPECSVLHFLSGRFVSQNLNLTVPRLIELFCFPIDQTAMEGH